MPNKTADPHHLTHAPRRPASTVVLCAAVIVALTMLLPQAGRAALHDQGLAPGKEDRCTGLLEIAGTGLCTHGPDPAPEGFAIGREVLPVGREVPPVSTGSMRPLRALRPTSLLTVTCDGDGTSGKRVQVMYVRASDRSDRYAQYLASIKQWAADMDQIYFDSAAQTGGVRRVRFVHDGNCQPTVDNVVIAPTADDDFGSTITALQQQGYNRSDRKYLIFADANIYCGIGTLHGDDRPIVGNLNDGGPSYARVDAGCWSGEVAAHEIMHNIGGVQNSAPHSSGGNHCVDEYDRMCYSDSPNYPTMAIVCLPAGPDDRLLDCNHDDYYHTNPTPGSYLATHWNSAGSGYLIVATSTPSPSATPPVGPVLTVANVSWSEREGNDNGFFDPDERFAITVTLHNSGTLPATGVAATLGVPQGSAIVGQASAVWPTIGVGADGVNGTPFTVYLAPAQACGGQIRLHLAVQYNASAALGHDILWRVGQETALPTQSYAYTGPSVNVPDNNIQGVRVPITLTAQGSVTDIDAGINLTHTWDGDMAFYLEAPDGAEVPLILNRGEAGHNFAGTVLDDEAAVSVADGSAPFTGHFRPEYPLSLMDDRPVAGAWKLLAIDVGPQDLGVLSALTLTVASRRFDCVPVLRGDCNGDATVDAADVSATVLEIFDGDGNAPAGVTEGSFNGRPAGCNANADDAVDAGDLACLARRIYGALGCP